MTQTSCPKCGRSFRTQSGLRWHVERYHSDARQATLPQNQPTEAETAWRVDLEQVQEQLAEELDTRLEVMAQEHKAAEARLKEQLEKMTADAKEKLLQWLEVRLSNLARERFAPMEQRLSSLESEQRVLKTQEDNLERRLDTLDRRISVLEPKPRVCSLSRKPRSTCQEQAGERSQGDSGAAPRA